MGTLTPRIRWTLVVLPAFLVGGFEYVRHGFFENLPADVGNAAAAAVAAVGSLFYYLYTFSTVERLTASLHEERKRQAVMEERERIAGELHDSVAQTLFFLNAQLERAISLVQAGRPEDALGPLQEAKEGVAFAHTDLRNTIAALHEARSLQEARMEKPLAPGVQELVTDFYRQSGVDVELVLPQEPVGELPDAVRHVVFRFVQEALNNVRKHARARRAKVEIARTPEGLRVAVEDDGVGIDPGREARGFGLSEMERLIKGIGGTLQLESRAGGGTVVAFTVPADRLGPAERAEAAERAAAREEHSPDHIAADRATPSHTQDHPAQDHSGGDRR